MIMWNPAGKGYTSLREKVPVVSTRFLLRGIVGCLIFGIVVLFHDLPFNLVSKGSDGCASTAGLYTEVLGGVPGYLVLQNVWYRNQTFYLYNPHTDGLPQEDEVLSHPGKISHSERIPTTTPDFCFHGSTLMLNENGQAGWHGLWHYYHFAAENIVAGLAALSIVKPSGYDGLPDQLLIPWENDWHDRFGMNEMVIKGIFGQEMRGVWGPTEWNKAGEDGHAWGFFDQVAIVDRWTVHRKNPSADLWNKMPEPILSLNPPKGFFEPAREALLKTYGIDQTPMTLPHVIYIDRQNTDRRMPNETHDGLIDLLETFHARGEIEFRHVELEDLTPHQQIEAVAFADIMIGIHGNGLTHEMWMPSQSTLIELFHPTSFLRDYESIATALGHSYYAVQNDTVLTREEWEAHPGERHANMMHDGSTIYLDLAFFETVLVDALRRYE